MRIAGRPFCRLLAAGLLALPSCLGAEHWAAYTDRRQNPLILEAMLGGDLDDALQAARALGLREDPYISDILSGLLSRGQEVPMLFLLRAVFPPSESQQVLAGRLSANRAGLDELAEELDGMGLALRRDVVRLLRQAGKRAYDRPVLAQAGWLYERLRPQALRTARADTELNELALEVLAYAGSSANPVFLDPVLRLRQRSRSAPVARLAAEVADELATELARTASGNPAGW
jgi:hypothetical protein